MATVIYVNQVGEKNYVWIKELLEDSLEYKYNRRLNRGQKQFLYDFSVYFEQFKKDTYCSPKQLNVLRKIQIEMYK